MREFKVLELEAKIAKLQKQLDDLQKSSFCHFDMFTSHLVEHGEELNELYRHVVPMFEKVFPGYARTEDQVKAILKVTGLRKADLPKPKPKKS